MQYIGYLLINGKKIHVLWRLKKHSISLKVRKHGNDGNLLTDESIYLSEEPGILDKLLSGKTISC